MVLMHVATMGKVSSQKKKEIEDYEKRKIERRMDRRPGKIIYAMNRMADRMLAQHNKNNKNDNDVEMKDDYE